METYVMGYGNGHLAHLSPRRARPVALAGSQWAARADARRAARTAHGALHRDGRMRGIRHDHRAVDVRDRRAAPGLARLAHGPQVGRWRVSRLARHPGVALAADRDRHFPAGR